MRMNTTLVINPKGGSGKTTIAVNLASRFASENLPTTLMDYDPQGSSLHWLRSRTPAAPKIYGANGAPGRFGHLRSFEMYVPPQTRHLIIDAPAGASGILMQEMIERAHCIVVPVVPSPIDIHATGNFVRDLLGVPRVRMGEIRVAVVANKVRMSMPAYQPLLHFLGTLNVRLQARLLDSDVYVRACETGIGIFEMEAHQTQAERRQFAPLADWVTGGDALRIAPPPEAADHEVTQIRRVSF